MVSRCDSAAVWGQTEQAQVDGETVSYGIESHLQDHLHSVPPEIASYYSIAGEDVPVMGQQSRMVLVFAAVLDESPGPVPTRLRSRSRVPARTPPGPEPRHRSKGSQPAPPEERRFALREARAGCSTTVRSDEPDAPGLVLKGCGTGVRNGRPGRPVRGSRRNRGCCSTPVTGGGTAFG